MAYYLETALVRGNSLHPQQPHQGDARHNPLPAMPDLRAAFPSAPCRAPCRDDAPKPVCPVKMPDWRRQRSPLPRAALPAVMLRPRP